MPTITHHDLRRLRGSRPGTGAQPTTDELMERAFLIVAVAWPPHPRRSRVEWLVGGHERAAHAIDCLLARGVLDEIPCGDDETRLTLRATLASAQSRPSSGKTCDEERPQTGSSGTASSS